MSRPSAAVIVSSGPTGRRPARRRAASRRRRAAGRRRRRATRFSPEKSADSPSGMRAEATPPSIGTVAVRLASSRSSASVGKEKGSGSRIAPAAPSSSGKPRSRGRRRRARPWRGTAWPRRRRARRPRRRWRCRLDLATVAEDAAGAAADQRGRRETVVNGGERRLGVLEMLPGGEDDGDVGRLTHEAGLGRTCRLERALERSVSVRYTGADADGHRSTILRGMPPSGTRRDPPLPIVALFGPTGVGKTAVGAAVADWLRFRGEDPVAISADALQVYAGLETLTGAAPAAVRARGSSTASCPSCPSTRRSRPGSTRSSRTPRSSTAPWPRAGGRS